MSSRSNDRVRILLLAVLLRTKEVNAKYDRRYNGKQNGKLGKVLNH